MSDNASAMDKKDGSGDEQNTGQDVKLSKKQQNKMAKAAKKQEMKMEEVIFNYFKLI
jgi:hypothetical protein